ncbi:MAG: carbohydrate kinase [Clostridiales bacterium]|nr:carbohydrate kinase [Clostridiales bacterium]
MKYILSVDNGLTTTKAVVFTLDGKEIASSLTNTVVESIGSHAEIDMELQWRNTARVIKESIEKGKINPEDIIGVGNTGHGAGLYCIDGNGDPVRKAISSMDARALGLLNEWEKEGKGTYDRLYQNLWSGQAIPILGWLKRYEEKSYNKINKIFMVKDWIIYRLTGEAGMEYTDASNSGLVNPVTKEIDSEILKLYGLEEMLGGIPPLRKTTDIAGYVTEEASKITGLKVGTPVMGGVFDVIACALGSGVHDTDKYSLIAGTWNINTGIKDQLIHSGETIKCSLYMDVKKFIYVESSATSSVNLEWFVTNIIKGFGGGDLPKGQIYKMIDEGVGNIHPEDSDIIYTPFLYKSHLSQNLDASFIGIRAEHGIFNLLRAVFEGVVFAHLKHIEILRGADIVRKKAVLSGGASNSNVWCQMFADILNMEIMTTQASQEGALGTAICTAVALGEYKDIKEAANAMVKDGIKFHPNAAMHRVYMKKYEEFSRIIDMFRNKKERV